MSLFIYKARNETGALITGEMDAENEKMVKISLADKGLFPVNVTSKGIQFSLPKFLRRKKARTKELISFTRQFAALFKSGVPMDRTLTALRKQALTPELRKVIDEIRQDMMSGSRLQDAFAKHPSYFDELYVNMLGVGEQAGILDQSLNELTQVLRREYRIKSSIKSATLYPKIVVGAFVAVVIVLMVYVIPGFADFYSGFGAELPLPTRMMIAISDIFTKYWYLPIVLIIPVIIAYKRYAATDNGRLRIDKLKFKLPVFGNLNLMVANARFGHLISALYRSGLPIRRTLTIVGNTIGNRAFQSQIEGIFNDVERGSSLADSMETKEYFTPLVVESVAVGEHSGALDEMLDTTAQFYDEEVDNMLEQLTTLIEPLLLFGLFVMIAFLAFAVFLPMWGISKVVLPST